MLIEIKVKGITPLMLDRFHEGLLNKGPKSTGSGEELSPKEQAEGKLYQDDKGIPIFPADNLLACIIDAGRFIKVGKRQLSTRDTTIVTSFLSIVEGFLVIKSKEEWRVDARGIVNTFVVPLIAISAQSSTNGALRSQSTWTGRNAPRRLPES